MKKALEPRRYIRQQREVLALFKSKALHWKSEDIEHCISKNFDSREVLAYIVEKGLDKSNKPDFLKAPAGVHWKSPWGLSSNGLCNAWRRQALALAESGMPLRLSAYWGFGSVPDALAQKEAGHLLEMIVAPTVQVFGFPIEGSARLAQSIKKVVGEKHVIASMTERDRIAPEAASVANQVNWWLTCPANIEAFVRSGVHESKLQIVPIPFFPNDPALSLVGRQRDPGVPRFYHIGSLCIRKNQQGLLLGFLQAFKPGEAQLVIKTTHTDSAHPDVPKMRSMYLNDPRVQQNGWTFENIAEPHVQLISQRWSEERITDLHRWGDVYVSISHGEGWDMPAYAAALAGNRLLYTPSGGPQMFASPSDLLVEQTGWERVHPFYCQAYAFEPDSQWITYDHERYVEQLQVAAKNLLPKTHNRDFSELSAETVGAKMRRLIESFF